MEAPRNPPARLTPAVAADHDTGDLHPERLGDVGKEKPFQKAGIRMASSQISVRNQESGVRNQESAQEWEDLKLLIPDS